jgi:CPA2 family monovalent cation:H+ antiporter-2/glutathione-regulated potassium-efflux system protein KefB
MGWRQALALGLLLSQGGEFGFVLFAQAQKALLIEPEAASLFGAIVTLSMATTPFLMAATRRFRGQPTTSTEGYDTPRQDGAAALVIGCGRFGQTAAQMLIAQGVQVTLIDQDPEMIDIAGSFGAKVYYGDGTRMDLLRQAGGGEAQAILFCIDGDVVDADLLHGVNAAFPQADVFVRAFDRRSLMKMSGARVKGTVREVFESAVCMGRMAMVALGVDQDEIDRTEAEYRRRDEDRLQLQTASGDLKAGRDTIITEQVVLPGGGECG